MGKCVRIRARACVCVSACVYRHGTRVLWVRPGSQVCGFAKGQRHGNRSIAAAVMCEFFCVRVILNCIWQGLWGGSCGLAHEGEGLMRERVSPSLSSSRVSEGEWVLCCSPVCQYHHHKCSLLTNLDCLICMYAITIYCINTLLKLSFFKEIWIDDLETLASRSASDSSVTGRHTTFKSSHPAAMHQASMKSSPYTVGDHSRILSEPLNPLLHVSTTSRPRLSTTRSQPSARPKLTTRYSINLHSCDSVPSPGHPQGIYWVAKVRVSNVTDLLLWYHVITCGPSLNQWDVPFNYPLCDYKFSSCCPRSQLNITVIGSRQAVSHAQKNCKK